MASSSLLSSALVRRLGLLEWPFSVLLMCFRRALAAFNVCKRVSIILRSFSGSRNRY